MIELGQLQHGTFTDKLLGPLNSYVIFKKVRLTDKK